jgi:hypothetical protein
MIYQLNPIKTKTQPLHKIDPEQALVRQLRLNSPQTKAPVDDLPFLDIFTAGPYLVPLSRRVE